MVATGHPPRGMITPRIRATIPKLAGALRAAPVYATGRMFWLNRNRLLGS
jgi:hypothetical protein